MASIDVFDCVKVVRCLSCSTYWARLDDAKSLREVYDVGQNRDSLFGMWQQYVSSEYSGGQKSSMPEM